MKMSTVFDLRLKLTKSVFKGETSHEVDGIIGSLCVSEFVLSATSEILLLKIFFREAFVPEYNKFFIKCRMKQIGIIEFLNSLLLFIQFFDKEKGILDS